MFLSDTPGQCLLPQLSMVVEDVEVGRLHPSPSKTAANGSFLVLPGVNNEKPKLKLSLYLLTSLKLSHSRSPEDFWHVCSLRQQSLVNVFISPLKTAAKRHFFALPGVSNVNPKSNSLSSLSST